MSEKICNKITRRIARLSGSLAMMKHVPGGSICRLTFSSKGHVTFGDGEAQHAGNVLIPINVVDIPRKSHSSWQRCASALELHRYEFQAGASTFGISSTKGRCLSHSPTAICSGSIFLDIRCTPPPPPPPSLQACRPLSFSLQPSFC